MGNAPEGGSSQQLEGGEATHPKSKYVTPHLMEYGSASKLTQGASVVASEGGFMVGCL